MDWWLAFFIEKMISSLLWFETTNRYKVLERNQHLVGVGLKVVGFVGDIQVDGRSTTRWSLV